MVGFVSDWGEVVGGRAIDALGRGLSDGLEGKVSVARDVRLDSRYQSYSSWTVSCEPVTV